MLKGIDPLLSAEVLHVLMLMGHGDEIVLCDVNHPAVTIAHKTTYGKLIDMVGCDLSHAAAAILTLFPLDTFVDAPVRRMQVVGDPERLVPAHLAMQRTLDAAAGAPVKMGALERFAFYDAASRAFAIVRTSDPGPYGCFIFKKGVV